jgi:hypothetical protein
MINKISYLVRDFGASQLSYYLTKNINELGKTAPYISNTIFYETMHRNCLRPNFSIMQLSEAWGQDGLVIATNINLAHKLLDFPCSGHKAFYVWDLEWTRGNRRRPHEFYSKAINHPDIDIIARNKYHASVIENCFNRTVKFINDDANVEWFAEFADEKVK